LTELPPCIGKLQSIESIYLNYTKLKSLPKSINQLNNLEVLNLRGNSIEAIPDFIKIPNLKFLVLKGNPLKDFRNISRAFPNLGYLTVDENHEQILKELFQDRKIVIKSFDGDDYGPKETSLDFLKYRLKG